MKESPRVCLPQAARKTWDKDLGASPPGAGERGGLLASPPAQPGRVFNTSPHPGAAGAGSGRGTNTAVTGHMAEALGNSGENRDLAAAGWWKGDSPGENSRTPCDHERDRFPSLGP